VDFIEPNACDIALVLQDKRFDSSGQIDYALTANDLQIGYTF
jgi:hypothetical protein